MAGRTPEPGPSWRLRDRQDNHVAEAVGARGVQWEMIPSVGEQIIWPGVLETLSKTSVFTE